MSWWTLHQNQNKSWWIFINQPRATWNKILAIHWLCQELRFCIHWLCQEQRFSLTLNFVFLRLFHNLSNPVLFIKKTNKMHYFHALHCKTTVLDMNYLIYAKTCCTRLYQCLGCWPYFCNHYTLQQSLAIVDGAHGYLWWPKWNIPLHQLMAQSILSFNLLISISIACIVLL